jgi:hypothetical protein
VHAGVCANAGPGRERNLNAAAKHADEQGFVKRLRHLDAVAFVEGKDAKKRNECSGILEAS